jgi:hypothetical protein
MVVHKMIVHENAGCPSKKFAQDGGGIKHAAQRFAKFLSCLAA